MAISDSTPTVTAQVVCDGVPLHEYSDPDIEDSDRHVTRYIEAVSDKIFEVHCSFGPGTPLKGDAISCQTFVDGQKTTSKHIRKSYIDAGKVCKSRGVQDGIASMRRYCFTSLVIDEEGNKESLSKSARVRELGRIRVELHHQRETGRDPTPRRLKDHTSFEAVSEKQLKGQAMSHSVGFKEPTPYEYGDKVKTDYLDPKRIPFAVYEFRYRSREALKSMLIIPRTPSPEPELGFHTIEDEEKDVDEMTPEELREIVRRSRNARTDRDAKVKIKREGEAGSPRRRKVPGSQGIATIELDDDGEIVSETTVKANIDASQSISID